MTLTFPGVDIEKPWRWRALTGPATARFSPCERYRYELTRTWNTSLRRLVVVGLNPSKADAFRDDNTIRRVLDFAERWACGGIVMLNLFAYRGTDPNCLRARDAGDIVGPDNDATIARFFREAAARGDKLVLGWGRHGGRWPDRAAQVGKLAAQIHGAPQCLGFTDNSQPLHPLMQPKASALLSWRSA